MINKCIAKFSLEFVENVHILNLLRKLITRCIRRSIVFFFFSYKNFKPNWFEVRLVYVYGDWFRRSIIDDAVLRSSVQGEGAV